MKVIFYKPTGKYRIIVPASQSGIGKRRRLFFDKKEDAIAEARKWEANRQIPRISKQQQAALVFAEQLGLPEHEILEAVKHYQKTVLAVQKRGATILEAAQQFLDEVKREKNVRTFYKYRSTMRRLNELVGKDTGKDTLMVELKRVQIDQYLDSFKPGTRRAQYANVKRFINWSLEKEYLAIDPMAHSKPKDKWGSNNEPLGIEEFRRILFVVAGLQASVAGEPPTMRYFRLLPFYVLGGLCGMRRAEIISSYVNDPVIEWRDINFDRKWVHVRHEVAKQTGANDQSRYIPLEPAAAEWLRLIPIRTDRVMEISQSTLQRLNHELLHKLKIEVPDNGLRNGYASWSATFRPQGELASAMGDLESTVKRYYITRREPQSGRAWFDIRPDLGARKIVPMQAVQSASI